MKKLVVFVLWFTSLVVSAGVVEGQLSLADGALTAGKVVYAINWKQNESHPTVVDVDASGKFKITAPEKDLYLFAFTHPGYEPVILFEVDLLRQEKVVLDIRLDRFKAPTSEAYMVVPQRKGNFDPEQGFKMTAANGVYKAKIPWKDAKMNYLIANAKESIHAPVPHAGVDSFGFFYATATPENGSVELVFDPKKVTYRTTASKAQVVGRNGSQGLASSWWLLQERMKNDELIRDKTQEQEFSRAGLEALFDEIKAHTDSLPKIDQIALKTQTYRLFGQIAGQEYNPIHELESQLETDPESLSVYPMNVIGVLFQQIWTSGQQEKARGLLQTYLKGKVNTSDRLQALWLTAITNRLDPLAKKEIFNTIVKDYPESYFAGMAKGQLVQMGLIGQVAPDFTLTDENGKSHSLKDFRGKWVLLDFWATWCGPCIAEIPNLVDAYKLVNKSKIEFVSISIDVKGERMGRYTQEKGMTWTRLGTHGNWNAPIAKTYGIRSIPFVLLLNPEGKIVLQNDGLRGPELLNTLDNLVK